MDLRPTIYGAILHLPCPSATGGLFNYYFLFGPAGHSVYPPRLCGWANSKSAQKCHVSSLGPSCGETRRRPSSEMQITQDTTSLYVRPTWRNMEVRRVSEYLTAVCPFWHHFKSRHIPSQHHTLVARTKNKSKILQKKGTPVRTAQLPKLENETLGETPKQAKPSQYMAHTRTSYYLTR